MHEFSCVRRSAYSVTPGRYFQVVLSSVAMASLGGGAQGASAWIDCSNSAAYVDAKTSHQVTGCADR